MKKTFQFLSMAALLAVGAIMTGCSNEDNIDNPQQPANNDNVVTLTATVSLDGGAQTRAITPSSGAKTFETGNQIAVIYKNTSNETVKAVSTDFTPMTDATKATFTVTLTNPASNSAVRYIYPATMAKDVATDATITDDDATIDYTGLFGSQNGNLTTLGTNYDLAVFDGSLSGTDLPASASLTNPLAICALTLTDGTDPITSSVNSLTISDGTNTYHVTPSSQSTIYVAMKPVASHNIAFTAATGSKTYFKTTASAQTLAASTLYNNISVSMVELAKGNVIGYDGKIYANKAGAEAVSTGNAAAVIVYLGSDTKDATFKNGLAIALANEGSMNWSTAKSTCEGKTAITGAKWCLPSQDEWKNMFKAFGGNESSYSGLQTAITNAGGTALQCDIDYWSSTDNTDQVLCMFIDTMEDNAVYYNSYRMKGATNVLVRPVLAF